MGRVSTQLEAQQGAKRKSDLRLAVGIDVVAVHLHLRGVAQQPGDHGGDFGGGAAFELRVNTDGFAFHMPVDEHARTTVAGMPFGHQILVPG